MVLQERKMMTETDRTRLREMIAGLQQSLPPNGQPYKGSLGALERRMDRASTVRQADVDRDTITMNSRICLRDMQSGNVHILTLTYDDDAEPVGAEVPVLTTLGSALLGSRVGDVVEWNTRHGNRCLRVERILFQPESAGKFEL